MESIKKNLLPIISGVVGLTGLCTAGYNAIYQHAERDALQTHVNNMVQKNTKDIQIIKEEMLKDASNTNRKLQDILDVVSR